MLKKVILGLSIGVGLLAVAGTVLIALKGDATGRAQAENDKASLSQSLESEFGGQAQVEFICQFPVVGVAPCIADNFMESREVKLVLTNSRLPDELAPDEQAFRIAMLAHQTSSFARAADKTEVTFQEGNVDRRYSFTSKDLIAGVAPAPNATAPSQ